MTPPGHSLSPDEDEDAGVHGGGEPGVASAALHVLVLGVKRVHAVEVGDESRLVLLGAGRGRREGKGADDRGPRNLAFEALHEGRGADLDSLGRGPAVLCHREAA